MVEFPWEVRMALNDGGLLGLSRGLPGEKALVL